jgi:FKBP-type peptidyl-prolyl cis-trans isomerase
MLSIRALLLFFFAAISSVAAGSTAEGLAFLNVKKTEEGVVSLPSGLMYKEIRVGTGKTPTVDSPCSCNYAGALIDGTEFDSSYKRGQVSCWCTTIF